MLRLSDKQRAVLASVCATHSAAAETVAKHAKLRTHVVRYYLQDFLERGIVRKSILFNPGALGFQDYNIFLALGQKRHEATIQFIKDHPLVSWFAHNSGEFGHEITIMARTLGDVATLLEELGDKCGEVIEQKQWAAELDFFFFGYKYLTRDGRASRTTHLPLTQIPVEPEALDVRIVCALRSFANQRHAELARLLGIPESTFGFRIQRLRARNVIVADDIYVGTAALRVHEAQLVLYCRHCDATEKKRLLAFAERHPQVVALLRCLGAWDYKLVVQGTSLDEIEKTRDEVMGAFPDFIHRCQVVYRRQLYKLGPVPDLLVRSTGSRASRKENQAFRAAVLVTQ